MQDMLKSEDMILGDYMFYNDSRSDTETLVEFALLKSIMDNAQIRAEEGEFESAWNANVHSPLLELAVKSSLGQCKVRDV